MRGIVDRLGAVLDDRWHARRHRTRLEEPGTAGERSHTRRASTRTEEGASVHTRDRSPGEKPILVRASNPREFAGRVGSARRSRRAAATLPGRERDDAAVAVDDEDFLDSVAIVIGERRERPDRHVPLVGGGDLSRVRVDDGDQPVVRRRHQFEGVVAVVGAIGLVQLSPYEWFTTQPPIPRALHDPLMLLAGLLIALGSAVVGRLHWPRRPRYAGLGILLGLWVAYPGFAVLGVYTETNPLGYLIVLALPLALGYVLWRDARGVLGQLRADRTATRFGIGGCVVNHS